jgi:hypothetical protein
MSILNNIIGWCLILIAVLVFLFVLAFGIIVTLVIAPMVFFNRYEFKSFPKNIWLFYSKSSIEIDAITMINNRDEIMQWLDLNRIRFYIENDLEDDSRTIKICFKKANDMMRFKLTWM